nr:MAG TPA: hypothetical protein [Caudoviricetes sp.]
MLIPIQDWLLVTFTQTIQKIDTHRTKFFRKFFYAIVFLAHCATRTRISSYTPISWIQCK